MLRRWSAAGEAIVVRDALAGYTSGLDLAHMRQVRDEIAEEIGRKIDPRDEYDIAFHQAKPWLEEHRSRPGTSGGKGGRSRAAHGCSYGEGLPFPFENGDVATPFPVGPWERPRNVQAIFPSKPADGRDKDFLKGGSTQGAHFVIGDLLASDTVIIAEGYATAATLHEATGHAAVMALVDHLED